MEIHGDLWLLNISEEEKRKITEALEDFYAKNPLIDDFVRASESDISYIVGMWAQSNFPQKYGVQLSLGYKRIDEDINKERKSYLEIRDSKHGVSAEAINQRGYSRRRIEVSNEIGDFEYRTKKYGFRKHIPKGVYIHDNSHALLPQKIENTIPPLEDILDRNKSQKVEYSSRDIRRNLGRDVLSYLIEKNKEFFE